MSQLTPVHVGEQIQRLSALVALLELLTNPIRNKGEYVAGSLRLEVRDSTGGLSTIHPNQLDRVGRAEIPKIHFPSKPNRLGCERLPNEGKRLSALFEIDGSPKMDRDDPVGVFRSQILMALCRGTEAFAASGSSA
jgi:hypothetical protein